MSMAAAGPVILHAMLGAGFGGLEQVFLDDQPVLERLAAAHGGRCVALARRGSQTAGRAAGWGDRLELAAAYSDWDPISRASVARVLRRHRPALAVVHGQRAFRLVARALPPLTPILAVIHKPSFDVETGRTTYVCVGAHLAEAVRARGVPAGRVFVVPNAVRLDVPRAAAPRLADPRLADPRLAAAPVIVAGGRLHEKKGFDILLRAMARLRDAGVAAECRIAGEGPERARLEALAAELDLGGRVRLAGWRDDLPAFLAEGDLFAFPSHQEGFPLVLLQAMAAGLPIVSSAIDGPNEMLADGRTGLLVPDADPAALADALAALAADPARARALGAAARAVVERDYGPAALERRLGEAVASTGVFDGVVSPP